MRGREFSGKHCRKHCRIAMAAVGGLILGSLPAATAFAQSGDTEMSISGGFSYITGDFGAAEDTDILFAPVTVEFAGDRFRFVASVPYISIKGPGGVVGGADGPIIIGPPGGGGGGVTTESGIGDVVLSAYYLIDLGSNDLPFFEIGGTVKLPTANENLGLGTGKTDFAAHLDIFKKTSGGATPFATIGYRFRGDPAGINLKNSIYASAGASFPFGDTVNGGVSVDFETKSIAGSDDVFEIVPFISWNATSSVRIDIYATAGLTDASPDFSVGIALRLATF